MADTQDRLNNQISDIPSADRYVFVDSENVASVWLNLLEWEKVRIDNSGEDNTIPFFIVFYTENTPHLTFEDCLRLSSHRDEIVALKCFTGEKAASALDFQLVSLAGYLIQKYPNAGYTIFSNDKGYDPMIEFWKQAGIDITRVRTSDVRRTANPLIRNFMSSDENSVTAVYGAHAETRFVCPVCKSRLASTDILKGTRRNKHCPNCGFGTTEEDWFRKYTESYFPVVNGVEEDIDGIPDVIDLDAIMDVNEKDAAVSSPVNRKQKQEQFVKKLLPGENKNTINMVRKLFDKGNPNKINDFYKSVINQFGQKKGLKIYHVVKPKLAEYKKL